MGLFSKKRPAAILPVIDNDTSTSLAIRAISILQHLRYAKETIQSVPGLADYLTTNLVPRLASAGMMGDVHKAIGILAADAVVGATIAQIARTVKEGLKS